MHSEKLIENIFFVASHNLFVIFSGSKMEQVTKCSMKGLTHVPM